MNCKGEKEDVTSDEIPSIEDIKSMSKDELLFDSMPELSNPSNSTTNGSINNYMTNLKLSGGFSAFIVWYLEHIFS